MQNNFKRNVIIGVIVVIVLSFVWGIGRYNSFISQNEAITGQWAQVDAQLQRRFDLIPNIVSTVKGIAKQEQTVFGEIADARSRYAGAQSPDEKAQAATGVESAISRLLVITENYPTLQSSQSFRDLTVSLEGTENRISVERMKYNDLVKNFNASVKRFPSSLVANMAGVHERAYFEVKEEAKSAPSVNFN